MLDNGNENGTRKQSLICRMVYIAESGSYLELIIETSLLLRDASKVVTVKLCVSCCAPFLQSILHCFSREPSLEVHRVEKPVCHEFATVFST